MTAQDEAQARPVVVVSGTDQERPMLEVLLTELRTFTMVVHARAAACGEMSERELLQEFLGFLRRAVDLGGFTVV